MGKSVAVLLDEINAKKKLENKKTQIKLDQNNLADAFNHKYVYRRSGDCQKIVLESLENKKLNDVIDLTSYKDKLPYLIKLAIERVIKGFDMQVEVTGNRLYKITSNTLNSDVLILDITNTKRIEKTRLNTQCNTKTIEELNHCREMAWKSIKDKEIGDLVYFIDVDKKYLKTTRAIAYNLLKEKNLTMKKAGYETRSFYKIIRIGD